MFLPKCIFLLIASHVSQTAGESQFASADYAQQIQQIMRLKAQLDDAALSTPKQIMKHYSGTDVEVPLTGNKKKDEALMREKKSKQQPKSQRLSGKSASMITVDAGGGIQTQAQTPSPHRMRNPDPASAENTTSPDPASAENTTSPDPASDEDTTSPDEDVPDEDVPDEVVPETTAPDEVTMSPAPAPDEDTTSPDPASDEVTTSPDEVVPDEVVPETTAPDEVVPDEAPSGECEKSVTVNPEAAPKDQEKVRCDRVCRLYPKYAAKRTNLGELLISVCPGCCGERLLEEAETPAGRCANWEKTVHEKSNITCKDAATWDEGLMCRERDETVVAMVTEACPDQCFASCCESCPDCCGTTP